MKTFCTKGDGQNNKINLSQIATFLKSTMAKKIFKKFSELRKARFRVKV